MQGTREQILDMVVHRRDVRVEELAEDLGITTAAVRRHLDNLRADGLVDVRSIRQATGRPYHAYHATERAIAPMPPAYADLLARMLKSVGERDDVITTVMTSVAEALASRHRDDYAVDSPVGTEERVAQVTQSLRQDGILESWSAEKDGFHLVNHQCPYHQAAEISKLPCESDRQAIELMLGLDVEQLNRIVDGSPICEYLVRGARGPQLIEIG